MLAGRRRIRRRTALGALLVLLALTAGTADASAAPTGTARATVKAQAKTYAFSGGKCKRILDGFSLVIGKFAGPRYFELQESGSMKAGTYRDAVMGLHVGGKYYDAKSMTLTITKNGRSGTFSGKLRNQQTKANAGTFRGSFSC